MVNMEDKHGYIVEIGSHAEDVDQSLSVKSYQVEALIGVQNAKLKTKVIFRINSINVFY